MDLKIKKVVPGLLKLVYFLYVRESKTKSQIMAKNDFRFNPETLAYEKIERNIAKTLYRVILPQFTLSIILGIFFYIGFSFFIESPAELNLKEANEQMKFEYNLLNKGLDRTASVLAKLQKRDDKIYRTIFQADPIPNSVRLAGYGGSDKYKKLEGFDNSTTIINASKRLDVLSKQIVVQSKSYDEIVNLVKNKEKMLACIPAIQPIANKDLTRFGSAFGYRMHPILHVLKMHTGIDLTAPRGTKIYASGDGVVERADAKARGYGNHIVINHGYGYVTLYGHMSKMLVRAGQKVKRGDVIGLVGSTGRSTAPHLHYEVRMNGKPVNPVNFYYNDLTDEEYQKMIEISSTSNTHIYE